MSDPEAGHPPDAAIEQTEEAAASTAKAAKFFDVRRIIGGVFTLYGVIVLLTGIFDGAAASRKAAGIDINIWTGIGMLLLGLFFLAWMWLSPPEPPPPADMREREGRPAH